MSTYRFRGLIWPAVLIVIGGIALLVNTNVISSDRLYRLSDLWPLLLVVIGLELIVTRTPMPANVAALAAVLILLVAAGGTVAYVAIGPAVPGGTHSVDHSAPKGDLQHASLHLDAGAATVKIGGADVGDDLFQAHIEYSGPAPSVSVDRSTGLVEISQNSGFNFLGPQRFNINVRLNSSVAWEIAVNSGASTETYDLSGLKLSSLEDNTGASKEDITLGTPSGNVPVTINGGALTINLHRPSGTAADVSVSGGVVTLDFDGHQQRGVGSVEASTGSASDMFAVSVNGGACTVTMDTNSPEG